MNVNTSALVALASVVLIVTPASAQTVIDKTIENNAGASTSERKLTREEELALLIEYSTKAVEARLSEKQFESVKDVGAQLEKACPKRQKVEYEACAAVAYSRRNESTDSIEFYYRPVFWNKNGTSFCVGAAEVGTREAFRLMTAKALFVNLTFPNGDIYRPYAVLSRKDRDEACNPFKCYADLFNYAGKNEEGKDRISATVKAAIWDQCKYTAGRLSNRSLR